ncbi:MAG: hypothetical protein QME96_13405, partial [Myxococcota bacterium]|nr:hypothetical protein [Myxococcota bacterium]
AATAAACGDDGGTAPPDAGDGDAVEDAADAPETEADDGAGESRLLAVVSTDYMVGSVSLIDIETLETVASAAVHADAVLRCRGGGVFDVVERFGSDRIRRFRVSATGIEEVAGIDLPDGSNPQDAAVLSTGEIGVPLYEGTSFAFLAGDLSASAGSTDLAVLADAADGLPEMHGAVEAAGRLFVSLQLLDRTGSPWSPTGPGVLAVIDPPTRTLVDVGAGPGVQGVALAASNPVGPMRVFGPAILLSAVGAYGVEDGGIEAVDPATGTTRGIVVGEAALGGDISDWIVRADDTGFALVTAGFAEDRLVRFDLDSGATVGAPVIVSAGYTLAGLVDLGDGRIAVGDRTAGVEGVRVFDAESGAELTGAPIDVGLPPAAACMP